MQLHIVVGYNYISSLAVRKFEWVGYENGDLMANTSGMEVFKYGNYDTKMLRRLAGRQTWSQCSLTMT